MSSATACNPVLGKREAFRLCGLELRKFILVLSGSALVPYVRYLKA